MLIISNEFESRIHLLIINFIATILLYFYRSLFIIIFFDVLNMIIIFEFIVVYGVIIRDHFDFFGIF